MEMNMRERLHENLRVRKHGQQRRNRVARLPQGEAVERFVAGKLKYYKDHSW